MRDDCDTTPCLLCAQRQTRDSMEPERTAPDPPAGEATGGSPEYHERRSTMHSVLPAIQSLVESSKIINVSINFFCLGGSLLD